MDRISFFGLGAMGSEIAGRIATAGYPVAVHDSSAERRAAWTGRFPAAGHAPADAAFIITCVTDDAALRALLWGEAGLIARLGAGSCLIDHTTSAPATARELQRAANARGALALDAPVSGGAEAAASGMLSIMVGGSAEALERARPIMARYAASLVHLGAAGAGDVAKLANQVAIAGIVRGLAEAVTLTRAAGLDPGAVLRVLLHGSARSIQLERLVEGGQGGGIGEPGGFAQRFAWLSKDLRLALEAAAPLGAALPMAELVDRLIAAP
jgi:3-hydroxyisobutyrate dehydrogenase-like beta-hydroxyacid dehydrogenase